MKKILLATLIAGLWINLCEFMRNEVFFKSLWLDHYAKLGLAFPSTAVNNALWALWGFFLSGVIVFLVRRLSLAATIGITWMLAFLLMWVVAGNLGVLPLGLLPVAVPWSMVEVAVAVWIAGKLRAAPAVETTARRP